MLTERKLGEEGFEKKENGQWAITLNCKKEI